MKPKISTRKSRSLLRFEMLKRRRTEKLSPERLAGLKKQAIKVDVDKLMQDLENFENSFMKKKISSDKLREVVSSMRQLRRYYNTTMKIWAPEKNQSAFFRARTVYVQADEALHIALRILKERKPDKKS